MIRVGGELNDNGTRNPVGWIHENPFTEETMKKIVNALEPEKIIVVCKPVEDPNYRRSRKPYIRKPLVLSPEDFNYKFELLKYKYLNKYKSFVLKFESTKYFIFGCYKNIIDIPDNEKSVISAEGIYIVRVPKISISESILNEFLILYKLMYDELDFTKIINNKIDLPIIINNNTYSKYFEEKLEKYLSILK
jgi:hypothetical protein